MNKALEILIVCVCMIVLAIGAYYFITGDYPLDLEDRGESFTVL